MDIDLARTFLEIVRLGSLMAAAQKLHVTQTAITARVQKLEGHLNCKLFIRNRTGARLTCDGEAFVVFANQLVQTWDAARRDLPLPDGYRHVLRVGAEMSLCNPLMLHWVRAITHSIPDYALHSQVKEGDALMKDIERGVLDAALVYQPTYWPGLQVEELLEEKLILVRVVGKPEPYIYIDWGPAFRQQHDAAMPEKSKAAVAFNLGPFALQYMLDNGGAGYFRTRVVQSYLDRGLFERVPLAPEFSYPTYLIYSRENASSGLQRALALLREIAKEKGDWSQRWDR
ncbi:LysR family transcriptional regulator [Pseudomonas sp. LP_7_YM]|uniref:LysR family transcriptional regulator n=1 Tax=Pseudomonas sp. LP_7_YM TaxID=2485137 RepID=UPI00105BFE36|nr:LysR family transcriptional regulator [Pseudomonas sp. LP_7_YM]TDV65751.1 DNA-binding transcriptional LysR family regulator [Pseudomonas sp. LP_7_YM]